MWWWLSAMVFALIKPAYADDSTRSLAKGGDWAAVEHMDGTSARSHVCLAIDPTVEMALRADASGTKLVVGNRHWDLPSGVNWVVKITFKSNTLSLPVTMNTNKTVSAAIDPPALRTLLGEMTKTDTMRIVVGETTPLKVSLRGSAVVLDAFRMCAGIS